MEHVLAIGGSGILRDVCLHYAEQGMVVSVVARDKFKIVEMVIETQRAPGLINPIAADYTDTPILRNKLIEAATHLGPPILTFCRVYPQAFLTRQTVAQFLDESAPGSRLFDFWCDRADNPGGSGLSSGLPFLPSLQIKYRKIILDSMAEGDGFRRLTTAEIKTGTLRAVEKDVPKFVIGDA